METRLKIKYNEKVKKVLKEKFNYKNVNEIPKIIKIVLNAGVGEAIKDKKILDTVMENMAIISGQKPRLNKSKKSIANFKLRDGMPVGCSVTLRRQMMWEFLDRFISIAAPRIKDFKGFDPNKFDGRGNYNFGIREQFIFPEINIDKVQFIHGMNITITTTAKTDEEAQALLYELGFPFKRDRR